VSSSSQGVFFTREKLCEWTRESGIAFPGSTEGISPISPTGCLLYSRSDVTDHAEKGKLRLGAAQENPPRQRMNKSFAKTLKDSVDSDCRFFAAFRRRDKDHV